MSILTRLSQAPTAACGAIGVHCRVNVVWQAVPRFHGNHDDDTRTSVRQQYTCCRYLFRAVRKCSLTRNEISIQKTKDVFIFCRRLHMVGRQQGIRLVRASLRSSELCRQQLNDGGKRHGPYVFCRAGSSRCRRELRIYGWARDHRRRCGTPWKSWAPSCA